MNKITISDYGNATLQQKMDLMAALDALNGVWNLESFNMDLGLAYANNPIKPMSFSNTADTSQQAWEKLHAFNIAVSGINFYSPSWWQRIKSNISGWIVDGAENPNGTISTNNQAWANLALADRAAFIAHEACHVVGYVHDFQPTAARPFSVPYQVESIITKLSKVKT